MFDTPLRRFKDRVGTPLAKHLGGVLPIHLSVLALIVGLLASYAAYENQYLPALGLWVLNRALDGLDGLIARLHNGQTDLGGYVDILTDFVIYATLPIGLVAGSPSNERYLALAFMLASFYVNSASWMYLAAILEKRAAHHLAAVTSIVMPDGLIGGFETFIAYVLFLLFPAQIIWLFSIFGILVFLTALQRLVWALRRLPEIGE
jgi:phosphatidylglycerophosphate synthase